MELSEMKRYDHILYSDEEYITQEQCDDGDWVQYSDAIEVITTLQSRIVELEAKMKDMIPIPLVTVEQLNYGHDYAFGLFINKEIVVELAGHSSKRSAEESCNDIKSRVLNAFSKKE